MSIQALVFDAYGTLFDVHSVIQLCEDFWPGKGEQLSRLWRAKQLEYTWQRSLMQRYADFAQVTEDALGYACAALGFALDGERRRRLLESYRRLALFPEAKQALARLAHLPLAILSNGSPEMLEAAVENAGLRGTFRAVISVHELRLYKPAPPVYQLAVTRLGLAKEAIGFISSNCWDACGAKAFGLRSFWINRGGAPADALGALPDHILGRLDELPALIGA